MKLRLHAKLLIFMRKATKNVASKGWKYELDKSELSSAKNTVDIFEYIAAHSYLLNEYNLQIFFILLMYKICF